MSTTPPVQSQNNAVDQGDWREVFLQRILIITAVVGIFALIPALATTEDLIVQGIYVCAYTILVVSILVRLPYLLKANIFTALTLILAIGGISETGIRGDSLFFLLAYVTFATLLIGYRGGAIALIVSELVILIMGYLLLNGHMTLSDSSFPNGGIDAWITAAASHLMISLVVLFGLRMLQTGFDQARTRIEEMVVSLRDSQSQLENRVEERTEELARKTAQIAASTFVAHQTASIQDLGTLLNNTVDLISKQFNCYHAAIFLINPRGDRAVIQAASSDVGKRQVENGFSLRIGTEGIVGFVAAEKRPRVALDVDEDTFYYGSEDLPETRSEIALPLIVRNNIIGVLDLQSKEERAFHFDELEVFQTLTDQIAIAIENARLLTESQFTISQLETISGENTRRSWLLETSTKNPGFHYSATGVRAIKGDQLPETKTTLNIPLVLRGKKIGTISLHRKDEFQIWTEQEEAVAKEVANQTALALENIRLVERTRLRANREQLISSVSARVRETLDLDTVLRTSAHEIQRALSLDEAEVRIFSKRELEKEIKIQDTTSSSTSEK